MKRSRDEIISKILMACLTPTSKTRIVQFCNLNFKTVDKYLNPLMMNGHIATTDGIRGKKYQTTEKGKQLLEMIKGIQEFL